LERKGEKGKQDRGNCNSNAKNLNLNRKSVSFEGTPEISYFQLVIL